PLVAFGLATLSVSEGAGAAAVPLTLSAASTHTVTVNVSVTPASDGASMLDLGEVEQSVTFAPGQTSATLTVPLVDDTDDEADELFALGLFGPDWAVLGDPSLATLTVTDNDSLTVAFAQGSYSFAEEDDTPSVRLVLSRPSQRFVTVHLASA